MSNKRTLKIKYPVDEQYIETAYHLKKLGVKEVTLYEINTDFCWIQIDSGARYTVPKDWLEEIKDEPVSAEESLRTTTNEMAKENDVRFMSVGFSCGFLNGFKAGEANNELRHRPQQSFDEWWDESYSSKDESFKFNMSLAWQASAKNLNH
jgi:hypothetical protein